MIGLGTSQEPTSPSKYLEMMVAQTTSNIRETQSFLVDLVAPETPKVDP